jgi:hypothetical protein
MLREALIVHGKRRVRGDGTLSIGGTAFETRQGYLAGKNVTIGRTLLDRTAPPWIEHEGQRLELQPVNPQQNGIQPRSHRPRRGIDAVPFDPATVMLRAAIGKTSNTASKDKSGGAR